MHCCKFRKIKSVGITRSTLDWIHLLHFWLLNSSVIPFYMVVVVVLHYHACFPCRGQGHFILLLGMGNQSYGSRPAHRIQVHCSTQPSLGLGPVIPAEGSGHMKSWSFCRAAVRGRTRLGLCSPLGLECTETEAAAKQTSHSPRRGRFCRSSFLIALLFTNGTY